jgi:carboxylesterase
MRGLGEVLAAQGYTVSGVRLAGHGGALDELRRVRWYDWYTTAEASFAALRQRCARVVVVGFSLGGALGLLLARRRMFEQLVLLATPLWLQGDWRVNLLPVLRHVVPWFYPLEDADLTDPAIAQRIREYDPNVDLSDPEVCAQIRRSVRLPMAAIDELRHTLGRARASVPAITLPTLIMHGRNDDTAPPGSADELHRRLGSTQKRLIWWEETGHQMLVSGPHREAIYAHVADFIAATRQTVAQTNAVNT